MRVWIVERYHDYARWLLNLAIFLAPVAFHRGTVDVFNLFKLTILWTLGLAAVALWVIWSLERGVWVPRARIFWAAAAFLLACALATIFSENPPLSLVGLYHRYGGLLPFVLYGLVMLLVVGVHWEQPQNLAGIARASAAAVGVMTIYTLIQAAGFDWFEWTDPEGNVPDVPIGTMGNSNFAGGYLGIALPFLIFAASTGGRFLRPAYSVLSGLCLLAIWFTQTRGGMIAAGAGLAAMALAYRRRLPRWVLAGGAVVVALALGVAVMVVWHPGLDEPPAALAEIPTFRTDTFTIRAFYWAAALRMFADRPLLGLGLETYFANYPQYRLAEDGAALGLTITDKPHSIFLEYAAGAGALGIGAYLALVGIALWQGYRALDSFKGRSRLLLTTFLAVLVGYLAQGFFSIDVPPLAIMGWISLGGIAAIADPVVRRSRAAMREPDAEAPAVRRNGPLLWPIHLPVVLVAAVAMVIGTRPVRADAVVKSLEIAQQSGADDGSNERMLARAIRLNPLEPTYRARVGLLAEQRAADTDERQESETFLQQALESYEESLRMQPGNVYYMINHARVYQQWGERHDPAKFEEADAWWKRVVLHDPLDWEVHNGYALMLNSWANATGRLDVRTRAGQELEKVVRIRPSLVAGWLNLAKIYRALGDEERAEKALSQALELDPKNEEALSLQSSLSSASRD
jgi:O-antigen ligase